MKTRIAGYLKPTNPRYTGYSFLFFDTESYIMKVDDKTFKLPLRLGVAIYHKIDALGITKSRKIFKFKTQDEFINILLSCMKKGEKLYIVAHNTGFDIRVLNLPRYFYRLDCPNDPPILNERLFIWKVKTHTGTAIFIDTSNYAVESVERLGNDLKFPKMNINYDNPSDEEMFMYCQRDVEIIEKFMIGYCNFIVSNKLGNLQVSLASQALTGWKASLMTKSIWIHNDVKTLTIEREAYHGGRVEVFRRFTDKCGRYFNFDINSLYPYIMANKKVPRRWLQTADNVPIEYFNNYPTNQYHIADVLVSTDENVYPIIYDGKLIFPIGTFRTQLHEDELMYAFSKGHVKHIFHLCIYTADILFDKYVNFFADIKIKSELDGNLSWRFIAKIFMNSLYGKFGQLKVFREIEQTTKDDLVWRMSGADTRTGERYQKIHWFGTTWCEYRSGECNHSNPAVAGAITASARMLLYSYILQAGKENVYYIDTDSIICNGIGAKNILSSVDNTKLGYLRFEGSTNYIDIRGSKDYDFGASSKIKGVPKKARLTDQFKWSYEQFQGLKSWMNEGATGDPEYYIVEKERKTTYNKGIIGQDGWIIPYTFDYFPETLQNNLVEGA